MPQEEKISLYYSEGSSDKEYHVQLQLSTGGFVVNFQYGRRGATLQAGTKTATPVDYAKAKKTYDKLVQEKTSKGYTPDVSGATYVGTGNAGLKTDFLPQLLNPITEDEAMRLIEDDGWVASEKMDGERRAAHAVDGIVTGMNRKGLSVPLPEAIANELKSIEGDSGAIRVDGEIIGDILYVFDLHVFMSKSLRQSKGCLERTRLAERLFDYRKVIKSVPTAETTEEKRALWNKVKAARGEGIVFKRRDCLVKEGRPNSGGDWLKYKFVESASCRVGSIHPSKRSISIELNDDAGTTVPVGNVTILPNYDIPKVGDIVEVEYLYAYRGGSLYQPVYRGKRTDIDPDACRITQLKFKPEGRAEDDES